MAYKFTSIKKFSSCTIKCSFAMRCIGINRNYCVCVCARVVHVCIVAIERHPPGVVCGCVPGGGRHHPHHMYWDR